MLGGWQNAPTFAAQKATTQDNKLKEKENDYVDYCCNHGSGIIPGLHDV